MSDRSPSQFWEPEPRYGACSGVVKNRLFIWGGGLDRRTLASTANINIFDVKALLWTSAAAAGTRPSGIAYAATSSIGRSLFSFGGVYQRWLIRMK